MQLAAERGESQLSFLNTTWSQNLVYIFPQWWHVEIEHILSRIAFTIDLHHVLKWPSTRGSKKLRTRSISESGRRQKLWGNLLGGRLHRKQGMIWMSLLGSNTYKISDLPKRELFKWIADKRVMSSGESVQTSDGQQLLIRKWSPYSARIRHQRSAQKLMLGVMTSHLKAHRLHWWITHSTSRSLWMISREEN